MSNARLIEIVIAAIVGAIAKEVFCGLIRYAKKPALMLKASTTSWLQAHFRTLDAVLDLMQALFQGIMAYWASGLPPRRAQMFVVALGVCAAFFYAETGIQKLVRK